MVAVSGQVVYRDDAAEMGAVAVVVLMVSRNRSTGHVSVAVWAFVFDFRLGLGAETFTAICYARATAIWARDAGRFNAVAGFTAHHQPPGISMIYTPDIGGRAF